MEDARTEYGLPKVWVKHAHAYTADTRLSSSSPPCALGEPVNEAKFTDGSGFNPSTGPLFSPLPFSFFLLSPSFLPFRYSFFPLIFFFLPHFSFLSFSISKSFSFLSPSVINLNICKLQLQNGQRSPKGNSLSK